MLYRSFIQVDCYVLCLNHLFFSGNVRLNNALLLCRFYQYMIYYFDVIEIVLWNVREQKQVGDIDILCDTCK